MKVLSILICFFLYPLMSMGKYTESFIVDVKDRSISVTSPLKKVDNVSIIINNKTLDKIVSELRSEQKVLKRFVLKPEGKEVIQLSLKGIKKLYYVPIAPPFEAAELRFEQRAYEIPEKK